MNTVTFVKSKTLRGITLAFFLFLNGCAYSHSFYEPLAPAAKVGAEPGFFFLNDRATIILSPNVRLSIKVDDRGKKAYLTATIYIPDKNSVQLEDDILAVRSESGTDHYKINEIMGVLFKDRSIEHRQFAPKERLPGSTGKTEVSQGKFEDIHSMFEVEIVMPRARLAEIHFPKIVINNRPMDVPPVKFRRKWGLVFYYGMK